jgi:hypothetical protein
MNKITIFILGVTLLGITIALINVFGDSNGDSKGDSKGDGNGGKGDGNGGGNGDSKGGGKGDGKGGGKGDGNGDSKGGGKGDGKGDGKGGGKGDGNGGGNGDSKGGGNGDGKSDDMVQVWLNAHNKYRGDNNKLSWDFDLAKQAESYATKLSNSNSFAHGDLCNKNCTGSACAGGSKCGQNLEKASGKVVIGQAVDRWYNECSNYKLAPTTPEEFRSQGEVFHYTQVVWKDAKKVGCGTVGGISNCLYDRGNILGNFSDNVPPPGICRGVQNSFESGSGVFDL